MGVLNTDTFKNNTDKPQVNESDNKKINDKHVGAVGNTIQPNTTANPQHTLNTSSTGSATKILDSYKKQNESEKSDKDKSFDNDTSTDGQSDNDSKDKNETNEDQIIVNESFVNNFLGKSDTTTTNEQFKLETFKEKVKAMKSFLSSAKESDPLHTTSKVENMYVEFIAGN